MNGKFKVRLVSSTHYDNEYDYEYVTLDEVVPESISIECPHCSVYSTLRIDAQVVRSGMFNFISTCPSCEKSVFIVAQFIQTIGGNASESPRGTSKIEAIYPHPSKSNLPAQIPKGYANDFQEAFAIREISPKASAAISRRILQSILSDRFGIKDAPLQKQIHQFIELKDVPSYLAEAVDAIRQVGNLAAHPTKDTNTGEIVEVETGEAEWLLEVLEQLFDFAFVQPAKLVENKQKLAAKLKATKTAKPNMPNS